MLVLDLTPYKLLDWIPQDKIDWSCLSENPRAVFFLGKHLDKIDWIMMSKNPNAILLFEQYPNKINWDMLSANSAAIHLLEANQDKICWYMLSLNPGAIELLEQNQDKIHWRIISENSAIFEIDYQALKARMQPLEEELMQKCYHPDRFKKYLLEYHYDLADDDYISDT